MLSSCFLPAPCTQRRSIVDYLHIIDAPLYHVSLSAVKGYKYGQHWPQFQVASPCNRTDHRSLFHAILKRSDASDARAWLKSLDQSKRRARLLDRGRAPQTLLWIYQTRGLAELHCTTKTVAIMHLNVNLTKRQDFPRSVPQKQDS